MWPPQPIQIHELALAARLGGHNAQNPKYPLHGSQT
jgi:hypothetical protein